MKRFPWRGLLYAVLLLYLILDLKFCEGPLRQAIVNRRDAGVAAAVENKWVAIINLEPVTREQLDLAVIRHLYLRGKMPGEIPEKNLTMIRRAVLQSVIDETLVRHYADGEGFVAPQEEIDRFVASWETQFPSPDDLAARAAAQGLDEAGWKTELARIYSRKRWLEKRIAPAVTVTEEEAREWFEANQVTEEGKPGKGFVEPEKLRARRIFLRRTGDGSEQETRMREIEAKLKAGTETFESLSKAYSEEDFSKNSGGELNWFSRERIPEDFADIVFALKAGEGSKAFATSSGWHLVEVLERQEERPVLYEDAAQEIRNHLEAQRTEETIKTLMQKLRRVANIQLFPENI
jgi:hypothetical protein